MRWRRRHRGKPRRPGRLRRFLASRLFFRVYITLLICLAAVAGASAIYWRSAIDNDMFDWRSRRDLFIEQMLPAGEDPEISRDIIRRFAKALSADISVYAPDGRLIVAEGRPLPLPRDAFDSRQDDDDDDGINFERGQVVKRLEDGRVLVARFEAPWSRSHRGPIGYILLIAAVVALAAFPVVRNLTRRLETLRSGVERFGEGQLVTRVPVEGTDEIASVARSFNRAADRIEGLVGSHRSLLANASHELRAPVTRLRMAVELDDPANSQRARDEILENLSEIDTLVEEILLASRLEHVGSVERSETVDLMALVAEECARHGIEPSGMEVEVKGDPRLLTRLVRNLVFNAQRHGSPPIEVAVARAGRSAVITVRDHGEGLPAGEEEKVFEPFYRPSGRSEAAGGWGLGLALVRQIAELHGGTARYEAADSGGAKFVVELPRVA
ncbi:MAG: HAMP domain-containing sensor histidine kinase [Mesorhizobium sp.]